MPFTRRFAQRNVSPAERGAIALERDEVSPRREPERDVEIATPFRRRARDELQIARREKHRREGTKSLRQPSRFGAIEHQLLASPRPLEADRDPPRRIGHASTR
jgi:hypothetical protein